jgi:hypothetical protein
LAQQRPLPRRSNTLAEVAQLLRRYEREEKERWCQANRRDFVEQVRHVLDGGLSDDARRALLNTVQTALAKLIADDALLAGDKPEGPAVPR